MNIEDTEEEVQSERIHHGRGRRRMAAPTVTGRSPEYYNWIPLTSGNHEIIIAMNIHTNSYMMTKLHLQDSFLRRPVFTFHQIVKSLQTSLASFSTTVHGTF